MRISARLLLDSVADARLAWFDVQLSRVAWRNGDISGGATVRRGRYDAVQVAQSIGRNLARR
jgi:hypothetical protein